VIWFLAGLLRDGSEPVLSPPPELEEQDIAWPEAEDGEIRILVARENGEPLSLVGGTLLLTVRRRTSDLTPLFARQADIVDADTGSASFPIGSADTLSKPIATYRYDVVYVDPGGGRHQVVPLSAFVLEPIAVRPAETVTPAPEQEPLALGPSWLGLGYTPEVQTDGTTAEQLPAGYETVWNFDDGAGTLENLFLRLAAIARVSAGTGTARVRVGGTTGQPDGDLLLTMGPVAGGLSDALVSAAATVLRPTGTELVKVTLQCSQVGERMFVRGLWLRGRGAP